MNYQRDWLPWYVLAWRLLWILPLQFVRVLFVTLVGIMAGRQTAGRAWDATA